MAKKNAKQNGVAKKKAVPSPAEDSGTANDVETVDLTAGNEADNVEAPSTSKASAKKKGKTGKVGTTMKAKAASAARKGGRPVKAPVRYEDPAAKTPKKKRAGGGKEGGGEYVVEAIRGIVKEKGDFKFLIKWENYSESSNTWEPPANVKNCASQIKKFLDSVAKFGTEK